eukprot:TRINITY_DN15820_c0_g1_i2.p1 TRINITY_DN15820_c0_g1~~TRINITY_DN15820_c0_g1_i2.p1  ORF type:complete len:155 (-),score=22.29 TRINITY_DN15820_c0_g1_i2:177-641(-)
MAFRVLTILTMFYIFGWVDGNEVECEMASSSGRASLGSCTGNSKRMKAKAIACAGKSEGAVCEDYVYTVEGSSMHRRRSSGCFTHIYKGGRCQLSAGYECTQSQTSNCGSLLPAPKYACEDPYTSIDCYYGDIGTAAPPASATIALTIAILVAA